MNDMSFEHFSSFLRKTFRRSKQSSQIKGA